MQKFKAQFYLYSGRVGPLINARAVTVDFEDVSLPSGGYYNGSDLAGGFTSRGVFFPNTFTDWGYGITSWDNWACSSTTDATTGNVSQSIQRHYR